MFEDIEDDVILWAERCGILDQGTITGQLGKLKEEAEEVEDAFLHKNETAVLEELGDVLVVCSLLAKMMGADCAECLALAETKIQKRKGKMVDGVFVKEAY